MENIDVPSFMKARSERMKKNKKNKITAAIKIAKYSLIAIGWIALLMLVEIIEKY